MKFYLINYDLKNESNKTLVDQVNLAIVSSRQFRSQFNIININPNSFLADAIALLDKFELGTVENYVNWTDRQSFIFAHSVLRLLLAFYCKQSTHEIEYRYGIYGKPYLECSKVKFNISYGNGIQAIAISNSNIGIDIELEREGLDFESITQRFFSSEEQQYLDNFHGNLKRSEFYSIWTRKEAALKLAGLGVDSMPKFCVIKKALFLTDEFGNDQAFLIRNLPTFKSHHIALAEAIL